MPFNALASSGKHAEGRCQRDFTCPHPSHHKYPVKKHVLVCEEHNTNEAYKVDNQQCTDRGIYLLQQILVNNNKLLIFYDNGCSDFVVSEKAVQLLGSRATKESSQQIILSGVGNTQTKSSLGTYSVKLPLSNGNDVSLSGICLQHITSNFPVYPLATVEKDIQSYYSSTKRIDTLPTLPSSIGGEVHMMIGIKYLRYHPRMVFQLPSGLAIYESKFNNTSGGRGVVGGPHHIFTNIHQHYNSNTVSTFFSDQYKMLMRNQSNVPLLGYNQHSITSINSPSANTIDESSPTESDVFLSTSMRIFEEVEATGSEIAYRCPQCRSCKTCKHESSSMQKL